MVFGEKERLAEFNEELVRGNEARLDSLLAEKLAKPVEAPKVVKDFEPLARRKPWASVRDKFEADQRAAYWKSRIKDTEENGVLNDPVAHEVAQDVTRADEA